MSQLEREDDEHPAFHSTTDSPLVIDCCHIEICSVGDRVQCERAEARNLTSSATRALCFLHRDRTPLPSKIMIAVRRRGRQDLASASICSTCTTTSNTRCSDTSTTSPYNPALLSPPRPILRSARRFILPLVPPAWSPFSHLSSHAALRDFCLPRQEPRPAANVLKRLPLCSCSPSLAKFSRTSLGQHVSISTSTTTLPSAINTTTFLHPTMDRLPVTGLKLRRYHHHHHPDCRHRR